MWSILRAYLHHTHPGIRNKSLLSSFKEQFLSPFSKMTIICHIHKILTIIVPWIQYRGPFIKTACLKFLKSKRWTLREIWFYLWHVKSLEIVTPILRIRKSWTEMQWISWIIEVPQWTATLKSRETREHKEIQSRSAYQKKKSAYPEQKPVEP